ncbi:PREDICTED: probable leucine-rich repeat receptor-like protein kinase At5g49770 [Erythranthe guttata]|uniref:probable leucine-rich repeat receptor-like protein kinase At5g49770 n=1 Tax=Erythranthe guttata TaxID=4155 RepID=UPI00064DEC48|nr:PREDICTED: probable leucine-rich repeat receptor-like protein kinase At5g49770 [Erythranthe guttata]|eukprot:XP_012842359.1 PREDICTED: probable leucine-rich repeat receptor-like protein kinase At5g49770 [Erythranthe guttata]
MRRLIGNPICDEGGRESYCTIPQPSNNTYSTPQQNCLPSNCTSETVSSPTCKCAYPYTGTLIFRAPSFSNYRNGTIFASLENKLMSVFKSRSLPVDSVSVSNPNRNIDNYLSLDLQVFPSGQEYFNRTAISGIGFTLSNQTFKPPPEFGPFFFIGRSYPHFEGSKFTVEGSPSKKSSSKGIIIGAAVGGAVLFLLLIVAGVCACRQRTRAETADKKNDPFVYRNFVSKIFYVFCQVYRGTLAKGQLVAIKRAVQGSMQGRLEFKTEIELLSRVHHKNVVSLVGFCFDQGEQMLVYEFIANGTLRDSISGQSGIRLDWMRRLRIALGAAKGIQYLHDEADPPIVHRDIKSNNILLDERLNAKVADFGLSKIMHDSERGHVTTQGYLDPEYFLTRQLTEKSDVYSFGILLFELLTARPPIENHKHIVRLVKSTMDESKDMYNLQGLLDPAVAFGMSTKSVEMLVDLALRCVQDLGSDRPSMSEVVKEIENTMVIAGINPNAESTPSSSAYEDANKASKHPYSDENLFAYSGSNLASSSGFQLK